MAKTPTKEGVVLTDSQGNYYLLTREILEHAKLTGTEKDEIDRLIKGGDVTGFALVSDYKLVGSLGLLRAR